MNLPEELRRQAFFNCWTRKEAFIKCVGEGLYYPLDQVEVSLVPGEPATLLSVRGNKKEATRWTLYSLEPATNFTAAAAIEGKVNNFYFWKFEY
jgi:4'-phosphopantetheinyl transferase